MVAPLDWGLGHTTRCIPIIRELLQAQHQVLFAGNAHQQEVVKQEFSTLDHINLEGYNIIYPKSPGNFRLKLLAQLPKIRRAIRNEHHWLNTLIQKEKIDVVISDNRYGLYHKNVHSIIISHQLAVRTGMGNTIDVLVQRLHYSLIEHFNACWIPDEAGGVNIGGGLSHPRRMPHIDYNYIGILSRLFAIEKDKRNEQLQTAAKLNSNQVEKWNEQLQTAAKLDLNQVEKWSEQLQTVAKLDLNQAEKWSEQLSIVSQLQMNEAEKKHDKLHSHPNEIDRKNIHLFISLSGPEPQRTVLEDLIIEQLFHFNGTAVVVRGVSKEKNILPSTNRITFFNHLHAAQYHIEMQKATYVISRSGYSTLMDLAITKSKGIVIPTPGQTEQEYLAVYGAANKRVISFEQKDFSLATALLSAEQMDWSSNVEHDGILLKKAINALQL